MYARFSAGGLIVVSMATLPVQMATLRLARLLLEITGFGFALYCLAALVLWLTGLWLRARTCTKAGRRGSVEGR